MFFIYILHIMYKIYWKVRIFEASFRIFEFENLLNIGNMANSQLYLSELSLEDIIILHPKTSIEWNLPIEVFVFKKIKN